VLVLRDTFVSTRRSLRGFMDTHIIELRELLLRKEFDAANARIVVEWLIAAEDRAPVVLVGAGFSRNARHKHRGDFARPSEIPLWSKVAAQMAVHLRVPPNRYDAPTMAEMYASSFGDGELRDLLRSMLPDEELDAGPAHDALGRYGAEAVITTNLLDTLLEKAKNRRGDRWNRVIADADLSARTKGAQRTTDLVYFHGHRCSSDTWIMTRSQYEDVAKKKPVVVARVRQLLAQHPLIVVGFGMTDPNFHNVYRQLGNDIQHHHPLGLAIQLDEPHEAERRHWMGLGLRIAVPERAKEIRDNAATSNEFFSWLFQHLSTSWSPDDEATSAYVQDAKDPHARFERFRGILLQQKKRADGAERYLEQASEFDAWKKTLLSFLTEAEETAAEGKAREVAAADYRKTFGKQLSPNALAVMGDASADRRLTEASTEDEKPPAFSCLPAWMPRTSEDAWRIDLVLGRTQHVWRDVAQHFQLALKRELFRTERAEMGFLPWIPLTLWLAIKGHFGDEKALSGLARECLEAARKYGDTQWEEIITKEALDAGVTLPAEDAKARAAEEGTASPERAGFHAMLDGDHEAALSHYRRAAEGAMAEGDEFEEWAWRHGEQLALRVAADPFRRGTTIPEQQKQDLKEQQARCADRISVLKETSLVRSWLGQTGTRVRRTLTDALERCESRALHRAKGGSGFSFTDDMHMAWRSFRDLEAIYAPPHLQERYLAPLLWESGFKPEDELQYRMKFDMRKTEEWLDRQLDSPSASVKDQGDRDAKLAVTFFSEGTTPPSKSERLGRLLALPGLKEAFRREDVGKLPGWLAQTRAALGLEVMAYSAHRFLDRDYATALTAVATVARSEQVRPLMEAWRKNARRVEPEELTTAIYRLPWFRWGLTEPGEVAAWLRSMAEEAGADSSAAVAPVRREDEMQVFALWRIAYELKLSAPALFGADLRQRLQHFAERFHGLPVRDDNVWEARRGGYLLEKVLGQAGAVAGQLYDRWASAEGWADPGRGGRRRLRWLLIADELDEFEASAVERDALVERVQTLWREVEDETTWGPIQKHYALNPHQAIPVVRFLVTCLLLLDNRRDTVARRLLPLLAAAPSTLRHVARALTPEAWGSAWPSFVDQVVASAGGAASTLPAAPRFSHDDSGAITEHQLGAIGLWADSSYRARRGRATVPSVLDWPLRAAALLALADERTLVANHAAYALVAAAETTIAGPDDNTLMVQALQRIARDTRVTVRMAAAYGCGRLKVLAKSPNVLAAATQIDAAMADDQNAMITVQRELGRLQAERDQRRSGGAGQ
jgi:hypothetical protein